MPFLGKTPSQIVDPEVDIDGGSINGTTIGDSSASPATVTTFTSSGIDDNATSTAITIDAAENVGIGTDAPAAPLQVEQTATAVTSSSDLGLVVGQSSGAMALNSAVGLGFRMQNTAGGAVGGNNMGSAIYGLQDSTGTNTGALSFHTRINNNSFPERMRIDASGNVGIGRTPETSPQHIFDVSSGAAAARSRVTSTSSVQIIGNAGSGGLYIDSEGSAADIIFRNTGSYSERMRIDSSGRVGIGTTVLQNPLTVHLTPNTNSKTSGSAFDGGAIRLTSSAGLSGTNSEMAILAGAEDTLSAGIGFARENGNNWGTQIRFYTHGTAITTTDELTERMRLDASGKLLVGATASIGGAAASTVQITHTTAHNGLTIKNSGNARYYIHAIETATGNYAILNDVAVGVKIANGASAWSAFSDESLKENISDIGPVLDTIKDYQCVNYSLKATESETADKVGFIAQDWEHDFPNVVSKDDDGNLGMKYTETIPVLLKAIQEQQAMIEELKAEVAALKAGDV